jgi:hypothetical protein
MKFIICMMTGDEKSCGSCFTGTDVDVDLFTSLSKYTKKTLIVYQGA